MNIDSLKQLKEAVRELQKKFKDGDDSLALRKAIAEVCGTCRCCVWKKEGTDLDLDNTLVVVEALYSGVTVGKTIVDKKGNTRKVGSILARPRGKYAVNPFKPNEIMLGDKGVIYGDIVVNWADVDDDVKKFIGWMVKDGRSQALHPEILARLADGEKVTVNRIKVFFPADWQDWEEAGKPEVTA